MTTCTKCGSPTTKTDGIQGENMVEVAVCNDVRCGFLRVLR